MSIAWHRNVNAACIDIAFDATHMAHQPSRHDGRNSGLCLGPEAMKGFQVGISRFLDFSSLVDITTWLILGVS